MLASFLLTNVTFCYNIRTHSCNNFSRLVTALHSKSKRVSFIILTVMVSSELDTEVGCISVVFDVTLLSLSVLGDVVLLTIAPPKT